MSLPSFMAGQDLSGINFNDHTSLTKALISLNVAFIALVTFVTAVRMSIRLFFVKAAGVDDWLMLLATTFTILLCSFSLVGAHFGLGTHIYLLSMSLPTFLHKATRITQSLYGCYLAYATSITLTKASIIVSYLRIFPNQGLRRLVMCTAVLVGLMWICNIFVIVFECAPVSAAWDWTENGRCVDILKFFYVSSSINIATDVILWIAPLPIFWAMNMRRGERVILCALFGFGFFACMASTLRLAQLHGLHAKDLTYTSVPSLNWSVAEVSTAILCACIPPMRPLATILLPKTFLGSLPSEHLSTSHNPQSARNLNASPPGTSGCGGDEEEGYEDGREWEEPWRPGQMSKETVRLKDILKESRIGSREVAEEEAESLPQTPDFKRFAVVSVGKAI